MALQLASLWLTVTIIILFPYQGIIGIAMLNVLILDDNLSRYLATVVRKAGHNAYPAETLAEARIIIETDKIDVALVDIHLHGGLGTDLIPELKEKQIPCYVLTAFKDMENLAKDADGILDKPFENEQLLTILGTIESGK